MYRLIAVAFVVLATTGCQSTMVRKGANKLVSTLPDLYYEQVINNLALACGEPDSLPYFATASQGTHTDARQVAAGWMPAFSYITSGVFVGQYLFDKQGMSFSGQYQHQQQCQMIPVNDPDKLMLMRAAYHEILGCATNQDVSLLNRFYASRYPETAQPASSPATVPVPRLAYYFTWRNTDPANPKPAWLQTSDNEKDVPKEACYVGQHCGQNVWVVPGCESYFTEFALAILDMATLDTSKITAWKPPTKRQIEAMNALDNDLSKEDLEKYLLQLQINNLLTPTLSAPRINSFPYPTPPVAPGLQN